MQVAFKATTEVDCYGVRWSWSTSHSPNVVEEKHPVSNDVYLGQVNVAGGTCITPLKDLDFKCVNTQYNIQSHRTAELMQRITCQENNVCGYEQ